MRQFLAMNKLYESQAYLKPQNSWRGDGVLGFQVFKHDSSIL